MNELGINLDLQHTLYSIFIKFQFCWAGLVKEVESQSSGSLSAPIRALTPSTDEHVPGLPSKRGVLSRGKKQLWVYL